MLNCAECSDLYMRHVRGIEINTLFNIIFSPASWITGLYVKLADFLRLRGILKTDEPSLPVISAGNLSYGGTNKTPSVKMLAQWALSKGVKTGIVTRGYTGKNNSVIILYGGEGDRNITGDEPLMLSRELPDVPVAIAKRRIDGVNELRKIGVELVIADDAFQHRGMSRDCDIVLIDALCPFGNGKLIPAGILRENIKALKRSDIVIISKSDMVSSHELDDLKQKIMKYVPENLIFTSCLKFTGWLKYGRNIEPHEGMNVFAFSAIGSPESFQHTVKDLELNIKGYKNFTDHHRYTLKDTEMLCKAAKDTNSDALICTEKDLYNLPEIHSWPHDVPLIVPEIEAAVNEPEKFYNAVTDKLKPRIIVSSNGYGEDAIGSVLAKKLRDKYKYAEINAFPLVGRGEAYLREGINVLSARSVTPSGGVLKYSLKDLWGDMRAGLIRQVREQLKDWRKISKNILTPICVGDVYLLLHALYGSGKRPLFMATAKTVYISGHWQTERMIIRNFTLRTWTRDAPTASQIGKNAVYSGSPIMDLAGNSKPENSKGNVILLLPGSRKSAANDVKTLLSAVEILNSRSSGKFKFRMVLAPTLDEMPFYSSCKNEGWEHVNNNLIKSGIIIEITDKDVTEAINDVCILLGMGGTANQLCAGLGVPVIAPDNKGKRVQKKLLGDAEILTSFSAEAISECALKVLEDKNLYEYMSVTGQKRMGTCGACDDVVNFTGKNLGWEIRENVYKKLKHPL